MLGGNIKEHMNVMKLIAESYYNCAFAICKNSSTDESKSNIGYSRIEDIPEEIDEKRHPKIAQRIREAQETITKAKSNQAKGGVAKVKMGKVAKTPAQNKKKLEKRIEKSRDESR